MTETIFWGFWVRLGQIGIEAALTILVGATVAGILRRMVGPAGTRRLFGRGWKGLLRGWFVGMLLPVCSLGVIPVAREMRRAGVPIGTILAFALAAPLLNPISFLYGLTLAEPFVILTFAAASLILSTFAGFLWERLFGSDDPITFDTEPMPTAGPRRILAVLTSTADALLRDSKYFLTGLVGSALLAAVIPFGALAHTMKHSDPLSPLLMTAVGIPIFSSPLPGMMKIGLMFEHGNSVGAAFVLFTLGIGVSLGLLRWFADTLGWWRVAVWFAVYVGIILGMAYAFEPLLFDTRKAEIDHTHAFDDYSCPFSGSAGPALAGAKLAEKFTPLERPAVYGVVLFALLGLVLMILDRNGNVERWLTAPMPTTKQPWYNVNVPGPVLGAVAIVGLIAFSVIGAYLYYPDRERCLDDMFAVYVNANEATRNNRPEEAMRLLEEWDLLVRKLEVGVYLRSFAVTEEQHRTAEELRESLEEVRDLLRDGQTEDAKITFRDTVEKDYKALKAAYRP